MNAISIVRTAEEEAIRRDRVRAVARKLMTSDDVEAGERSAAAEIVREVPGLGNPYGVQCDWCHERRMLFRDENNAPFTLTSHGWLCVPCDVRAATQEIKF
jgi:hypothetical protein